MLCPPCGGKPQPPAACFEETKDPAARAALDKAAAFAATKTDRLKSGAWYLHDSLEQSTVSQGVSVSLRRKRPCTRQIGEQPDGTQHACRYQHRDGAVSQRIGNTRHSARLSCRQERAPRAVLDLRPAEWLYCLLYWAIGQTFLPTDQARNTAGSISRALKRIAWKQIIPI